MNLVDYGIHNENSHIRAHVCPVVKKVYVYPTQSGIQAIETKHYPCVRGYQENVEFATAEGYLIPPFDIEKCIGLSFKDSVWEIIDFRASDHTSEKGNKAIKLVLAMVKKGLFPLLITLSAREITDEELQVKGQDIIVPSSAIHAQEDIIIQVKCDYIGGEKGLGGSGNLFLQTAESNPLKQY